MFGASLPRELSWLSETDGRNVYLLPSADNSPYDTYGALYHLLPLRTLGLFGLPLIKSGVWPYWLSTGHIAAHLPTDLGERLARAFAAHVWRYLESGSRISAFGESYPLKVLAHNLDFWLPHAIAVAEERIRSFPRTQVTEPEQEQALRRMRARVPQEVPVDRPLMGGPVWMGEEEAAQATAEVVAHADASGRLRGIIEAVRSNRVQDDFSARWSFAREDFERKLYRKRNRVRVSFVELSDTVPVHGPSSEVHEGLLWEDFCAMLDPKERRIVVLLRSGVTNLGEIGQALGYANHSPISKALAKIRRKAIEYLD